MARLAVSGGFIKWLGSISSHFGSVTVYPSPNKQLDHWSISLGHDVMSAFYANYHAGRHGRVCCSAKN